jgi:MoaD family protein
VFGHILAVNVERSYAKIILILQDLSVMIVQDFQNPQEVLRFPLYEVQRRYPRMRQRKDDPMPLITVKYLMAFSQVTGKQSESFSVNEGDTISDLLDSLYNRYGRKFKKLVEQDFENRSVMFVVNGESKEKTTVLKGDDEVLISYPVGGG